MLVGGAVGRGEADLCQGILETDTLCCLSVAEVGLEVPAGFLGDLADDKTARYVGDPVAAIFQCHS